MPGSSRNSALIHAERCSPVRTELQSGAFGAAAAAAAAAAVVAVAAAATVGQTHRGWKCLLPQL